MTESLNSFDAKKTLDVNGKSYDYFDINTVPGMEKLPYSLKVLAENLLRNEDGKNVNEDHIKALANWDPKSEPDTEIQFTPARVLMQDFTVFPVSSTSQPCVRPFPLLAVRQTRLTR